MKNSNTLSTEDNLIKYFALLLTVFKYFSKLKGTRQKRTDAPFVNLK
jgi:hypothetical protein